MLNRAELLCARPSGLRVTPKWGPLGGIKGQFWVFEGPRPSGTQNEMILSKKTILSKTRFFDPKLGQNAHKLGQNGVHWGVYRVNFGVLRVPEPLGDEIMQIKKFLGKFLAFFWPKRT